MAIEKIIRWFTPRAKQPYRKPQKLRPNLQRLETREVPAGFLAIGAGPGSLPGVAVRVDIQDQLGGSAPNPLGGPAVPRQDGKTDFTSQIFFPFALGFRGGVHTATGNFDGLNSTPDSLVTAAGPGGGPHVIVWNMTQLPNGAIVTNGIRDQFFAFDARFRGGVNVATGDLDGDGRAELICAAGAGGGPHVRIYKEVNARFQLVNEFFAFDISFRGGVSVASGQGYQVNSQMRLVLSEQLPADFQTVPYFVPGTTIPDPTAVPGSTYDVPLIGFDSAVNQGSNFAFGPGPGYTSTHTLPGHRDTDGFSLPYVTVGSGPTQYLSGNLLNTFGDTIYRPNILNNNGVGDIVFATFTDAEIDDPTRTDLDGLIADVTYGPFVRLSSTDDPTTVITRLTPAPNHNGVSFANHLIVGAGPGGGPHVKIYGFTNTGGQLINHGAGKEFFAFDASFRGGVNVAVGDVIAHNNITRVAGRTDFVADPQAFIRDNDRNSGTQAFLNFPFDTALYEKLKPDIIVSMASQGSEIRYFGDAAAFTIDPFDSRSDFMPGRRTSTSQLNLVPYITSLTLGIDPNNPLGGYTGNIPSVGFQRGIDNAANFSGGALTTAAAFRFSGSMETGFFGFNIPLGAGTAVGYNPTLAQGVFGAGPTPPGQANRGSRVRIFNQLGPFAATEIDAQGQLNYSAYDEFQAFVGDPLAQGAWVSYGYGVLPEASLNRALDVIYANNAAGVGGTPNSAIAFTGPSSFTVNPNLNLYTVDTVTTAVIV